MHIRVVAIGKVKSGPETALLEDYRRQAEMLGSRLGIRSLSLKELSLSQADSKLVRQNQEMTVSLRALLPSAPLIVLDERGKNITSLEFSHSLKRMLEEGQNALNFAIGGPDGHSPALIEKATMRLSFGMMTWPHRLVRIMLFEQIYRAVTLMLNHPYHRA